MFEKINPFCFFSDHLLIFMDFLGLLKQKYYLSTISVWDNLQLVLCLVVTFEIRVPSAMKINLNYSLCIATVFR